MNFEHILWISSHPLSSECYNDYPKMEKKKIRNETKERNLKRYISE